MDENQNDELEVLNQEEESDFTQTDDETVEELRERLEEERKARAKAEEIANNQRIRAEKAENKPKQSVAPKSEANNQTSIAQKDFYALIQANVPQDDIDDVVEYANLKNISVTEALKSNVVRTILSDNAEKRNVANATNVSSSRRASGQVTGDKLISDAKAGKLPESDEDIAKLFASYKQGK